MLKAKDGRLDFQLIYRTSLEKSIDSFVQRNYHLIITQHSQQNSHIR